jgi:hypothetical protein
MAQQPKRPPSVVVGGGGGVVGFFFYYYYYLVDNATTKSLTYDREIWYYIMLLECGQRFLLYEHCFQNVTVFNTCACFAYE